MAVTWQVSGRAVIGLVDSVLNVSTVSWGPNPANLNPFPWVGTSYPSLLLLTISVPLITSASVGTRRISIVLTQSYGIGTTTIVSATTQAASLTRRFEFSAGVCLDTPLSVGLSKETLPDGLVLLAPDLFAPDALAASGTLVTSVTGLLAGDSLQLITIHGLLV